MGKCRALPYPPTLPGMRKNTRFNYYRSISGPSAKRHCERKISGMEFKLDRTRRSKTSAHNAHDIRTATSFMPWLCRVPIGEDAVHLNTPAFSKSKALVSYSDPVIPGLPDDVAKYCLALIPRNYFPSMGVVSKKWRSYLRSKEFLTVRKLAQVVEEWLFVLTLDAEGKESHWDVLDCLGHKIRQLPPMPGVEKAGFGVVVLNGKLLVMSGYSVVEGNCSASAEVYQYDCCLNSWSKLTGMNVARYDFACAEVDGLVYVAGGYGVEGNSLSSVEVYNPDNNKWMLIESLRRPRWGCFACSFEGKLYVMGGRSSFTIGNSKCVDVYNPDRHSWCEMKNGCVMVTAHTVLGKKLFCMEWKNQRKLTVFNPEDNSWKMVPVPLAGSSSIDFQFEILNGKLLLFSMDEDPGYHTLKYDPQAMPGTEWKTSEIKPSGLCLCSVTIRA